METLIISGNDDNGIRIAANIIREGGLVAFPTETVYGLGASALLSGAAKKIYAAKGRPSDNPLIVHLSTPEDAEKFAYVGDTYFKLAEKFMPGPLTVILQKKDIIPFDVTGGLDTVGLRVPSNPVANKLIRYAGVPIAAPSANLSGKPSTTRASHVINDLYGRIDAIIDAGECIIGLESTIVSVEGDNSLKLLRPGGITLEQLKECGFRVSLDKAVTQKLDDSERPAAPGMKYRHYAPRASVTLFDGDYEIVKRKLYELRDVDGAAILCYYEDTELAGLKNSIVIGSRIDKQNTAHRLFALLRDIDCDSSVKDIYAALPEKDGIGLAIFNRLIKAAGYRVIKV